MAKKFRVTLRYSHDNSSTYTEDVAAWDFNILSEGVLVFGDNKKTRAYREWLKVEEIK